MEVLGINSPNSTHFGMSMMYRGGMSPQKIIDNAYRRTQGYIPKEYLKELLMNFSDRVKNGPNIYLYDTGSVLVTKSGIPYLPKRGEDDVSMIFKRINHRDTSLVNSVKNFTNYFANLFDWVRLMRKANKYPSIFLSRDLYEIEKEINRLKM